MIKTFWQWLQRRVFNQTITDYQRVGSHILVTGLFGHDYTREVWRDQVTKKIMHVKLTWKKKLHDFQDDYSDDIHKASGWEFVGFEGEKPVKQMSFGEYRQAMAAFSETIKTKRFAKRVSEAEQALYPSHFAKRA